MQSPNAKTVKEELLSAHTPREPSMQGKKTLNMAYSSAYTTSRPSNARIHTLEEENAQLRELLRLQSVSLNRDQSSNPPQPPLDDSTFVPDQQDSASDTIHVSETIDGPHPDVSLSHSTTPNESNQTPFHGPSSAVFEPETPRPTNGGTVDPSDLAVKNQLLAETTRQRRSTGN